MPPESMHRIFQPLFTKINIEYFNQNEVNEGGKLIQKYFIYIGTIIIQTMESSTTLNPLEA
jgi:hypothetical protein